MISRNAVFREDCLYKNLAQESGKVAVREPSETIEIIRNSIEVAVSSEGVTECQDEVETSQQQLVDNNKDEEVTEDLSNYQLARFKVRREIVKPVRFTDDSEVAFALSVSEEKVC